MSEKASPCKKNAPAVLRPGFVSVFRVAQSDLISGWETVITSRPGNCMYSLEPTASRYDLPNMYFYYNK
jgi:hypothetical protein